MQKIILNYVKGLPADANSWERRNHKKYGNITSVCRQIKYDMRHGVTKDEISASLSKIHTDLSFVALRHDSGSMGRLSEIEEHFTSSQMFVPSW
jgi:uncharacterized protein YlbG (UPF0298 family)